MTDRVFVYGLLRPGSRLHHVVEQFVRAATPASVPGRLYDTGLGYPAALFGHGGRIEGSVLHLDRPDEALSLLDEVESEGELYRRVVVEATTDDGPTSAWSYEWLRGTDGLREVGPVWP
ncbi:MAG TPA: gamma-glutamylcyclotransferase family protein [Actinomycetota bacterium]|nr:gamma-glutamylcyclotransferase family protein [Actinomycetota bacterium]